METEIDHQLQVKSIIIIIIIIMILQDSSDKNNEIENEYGTRIEESWRVARKYCWHPEKKKWINE